MPSLLDTETAWRQNDSSTENEGVFVRPMPGDLSPTLLVTRLVMDTKWFGAGLMAEFDDSEQWQRR